MNTSINFCETYPDFSDPKPVLLVILTTKPQNVHQINSYRQLPLVCCSCRFRQRQQLGKWLNLCWSSGRKSLIARSSIRTTCSSSKDGLRLSAKDTIATGNKSENISLLFWIRFSLILTNIISLIIAPSINSPFTVIIISILINRYRRIREIQKFWPEDALITYKY